MRLSIAPVSIPNGMEFYFERMRDVYKISMVSIPNGMEFYSLRRASG